MVVRDLFIRYWVSATTRLEREEGQTMAEYALILALIAIGVVAVMGTLTGALQNAMNAIVAKFP